MRVFWDTDPSLSSFAEPAWVDEAIEHYAATGTPRSSDSVWVDDDDGTIVLVAEEQVFYSHERYEVSLRPYRDADGLPALLVVAIKRLP